MINKLLFPETITLNIYKRTFTLRKSLSFPKYMREINEMDFSPHLFDIKIVPSSGYYILQVFFSPPIMFPFMPIVKPFSEFIILNRCEIRFSEENREIALEAGASIWAVLALAIGVSMIGLMLFVAIAVRQILPVMMAVLIVVLLASIYKRDVKMYEKMEILAKNK